MSGAAVAAELQAERRADANVRERVVSRPLGEALKLPTVVTASRLH
jgi:hypothetical protein